MGNTADLKVVQKTITDTLHKEGKSQILIAKEAGCSQSAVSKHVNVSGYVCNHGSPSGERDTASPRGRYGERLSVTRV